VTGLNRSRCGHEWETIEAPGSCRCLREPDHENDHVCGCGASTKQVPAGLTCVLVGGPLHGEVRNLPDFRRQAVSYTDAKGVERVADYLPGSLGLQNADKKWRMEIAWSDAMGSPPSLDRYGEEGFGPVLPMIEEDHALWLLDALLRSHQTTFTRELREEEKVT
jgi:hypothetical protein